MAIQHSAYWQHPVLQHHLISSTNNTTINCTDNPASKPPKYSPLQSSRLKRNLDESRRAFFNLDSAPPEAVPSKVEPVLELPPVAKDSDQVSSTSTDPIVSRRSGKKISFKIKKSSSIYRKASSSGSRTNTNTVAELASRFNKLVTTKPTDTAKNGVRFVSRKSSAKEDTKPVEIKVTTKLVKVDEPKYFVRRASVKRKVSIRKLGSDFPTKMKSEPGRVKATIQIFETITSQTSSPVVESKDFPSATPKPKVPEKNFKPETIYMVNKNKEKISKLATKTKVTRVESVKDNASSDRHYSKVNREVVDKVTLVVDDDDVVDVPVVSIPLVTKRCDSKYETMNVSRVSPKLLKRTQTETTEDKSVIIIDESTNVQVPQVEVIIKVEENENAAIVNEVSVNEEVIVKKEANSSKLYRKPRVETMPSSDDKMKVPTRGYGSLAKLARKPDVEARKDDVRVVTEDQVEVPINVPNKSFLWSRTIPDQSQIKLLEELEETYDSVDPALSHIPIRPTTLTLDVDDGYEYCGTGSSTKYEELDNDGYESCDNTYETLPPRRSSAATTPILASPTSPTGLPPPLLPPRKQQTPLPPRPPLRNPGFYADEKQSNGYEFIDNSCGGSKGDLAAFVMSSSSVLDELEDNYESIDEMRRHEQEASNQQRDGAHSLALPLAASSMGNVSSAGSSSGGGSCSLGQYGVYRCGGSTTSDRSASDRADEWIDVSDDNDDEDGDRDAGGRDDVEAVNGGDTNAVVVIREKPKLTKRNSGWSQKCRDQRRKAGVPQSDDDGDSDSEHTYERLFSTPDNKPAENYQTAFMAGQVKVEEEDHYAYDSFDSDSDSENATRKDAENSIDIANAKLPDLPNNQTSVTTLAKTIRKNLTKSFNKMTKRKSELDVLAPAKSKTNLYQNIPFHNGPKTPDPPPESAQVVERDKTLRKGIFNKFRRSKTLVLDPAQLPNEPTPLSATIRPKSTFYLTESVDVDNVASNIATTAGSTVVELNNKTAHSSNNKEYSAAAIGARLLKSSPSRPSNPPPPTPIPSSDGKGSKPDSTTLYAECGVFKSSDTKRSSTNWYADVGLYQSDPNREANTKIGSDGTTPISSPENSGSATHDSLCSSQSRTTTDAEDSSLTKCNEDYYNMKNESRDDQKPTRWQDEPLYQFYDAAILESEYKDCTTNYDYDGYEEVGKNRPSAMELILPMNNVGCISRTLWCEVPEVVESNVLNTLTENQQKIQEAKFEMLTSEASYLHSLNVLVDHFVKNIMASELLTEKEATMLFGNIFAVKKCAEKLLADMEKCWQDSIMMHSICEIVDRHAQKNFHVYVTFCENQIFLDSTLNKLKERLSFSRFLEQLERSSACQSLKLNSFLLLPMQRITRWRLLIDAVLKRLIVQDDEYLSSRNTMATLSKIAQQCNEAARKMERDLEMKHIASQLEFAKGVPAFELVSGDRWLVKSGPLTQMVAKTSDLKVTFGKRFTKMPLYLFLFNDILLITKLRNKDNYLVTHYCSRTFLEVNAEDTLDNLPLKNAQGRHLVFLTILENHEEKLVELLLACESVSDKERWLEAILPPKSENPDEIIYEHWDCPQVTAVHNYTAVQPDELSLSKGDVINVNKKLSDGWFHGEKISDSQVGWFPSNYTVEIANPHVRARNLKMRYRLLAFCTISNH